MKKISVLSVWSVVVLILFSSCNKTNFDTISNTRLQGVWEVKEVKSTNPFSDRTLPDNPFFTEGNTIFFTEGDMITIETANKNSIIGTYDLKNDVGITGMPGRIAPITFMNMEVRDNQTLEMYEAKLEQLNVMRDKITFNMKWEDTRYRVILEK